MTGARAGMIEAFGMDVVEVIEESASRRVLAE